MTTTTGNNGRLGNQIIRNLAVSLLAEKYNMKVHYHNKDLINQLGIELFSGKNVYKTTKILNDDNYSLIYDSGNVDYNVDPNNAFFQTKEITNIVYDYLHSETIKQQIIQKNQFKSRYNSNNDLFIHIRLGDVAILNPGITYYLETIKTITYDNLYISTDSKHHDIVNKIISQYPNAIIINLNEIDTFKFGSTCKHVILSHGSFSAVIGYLSFFSTIRYPEYKYRWYGDMFSVDNWIKIPY